MYVFGPGALFGTNAAANSTPRRFGGLQDVSCEFSFTVKELYGSYQFPLAIARGQGKINLKAKMASLNGATLNDLFFGQSLASSGFDTVAIDEAGTVPALTTYTVTVANGATWVSDLGVTYAATGIALAKVATVTAIGQYSVAAGGVYTFYSGDASAAVKLNYVYTVVTALKQIAVTNQLIGTTPLFAAVFQSTFQGKAATMMFNRCTSSKLNFSGKLDDYTIPEFDFSAFADDGGNIGTLTFAD